MNSKQKQQPFFKWGALCVAALTLGFSAGALQATPEVFNSTSIMDNDEWVNSLIDETSTNLEKLTPQELEAWYTGESESDSGASNQNDVALSKNSGGSMSTSRPYAGYEPYASGSCGFPSTIKGRGIPVIKLSHSLHRYVIYGRNGNVVTCGNFSGGKGWCEDLGRACRTPRGTFRVYRKGAPYYRSSRFPVGKGGAPMYFPHFFHGGYAIHHSGQSDWSSHESHGCARISNAEWVYRTNALPIGSIVIIF